VSVWDYVEEVLAPGDGATAEAARAREAAPDEVALAALTRETIVALGEDPSREGLLETPQRVARSLAYLTGGYRQTLEGIVGNALFAEDYDELVLVRDVPFYSLCEHHLLPIIGKAHLGYLPNGCVVGLSKLPRIVEMYARRLQVQERLTREIAEAIDKALRPRGVGVVVEAEHLCMAMRGVQKPGSRTVTSCLLGELDSNPDRRSEFLALVRRQ
jgi:GTP cyclohydrolase IA